MDAFLLAETLQIDCDEGASVKFTISMDFLTLTDLLREHATPPVPAPARHHEAISAPSLAHCSHRSWSFKWPPSVGTNLLGPRRVAGSISFASQVPVTVPGVQGLKKRPLLLVSRPRWQVAAFLDLKIP